MKIWLVSIECPNSNGVIPAAAFSSPAKAREFMAAKFPQCGVCEEFEVALPVGRFVEFTDSADDAVIAVEQDKRVQGALARV